MQRRYAAGIVAFKRPALLTLTVPNVRELVQVPGALELLLHGFERLRRAPEWPKGIRGLWALEVPWSFKTGFHPHVHVVADFRANVDLAALAARWKALTGALHQPDLKRAWTPTQREGLAKEAIKYVTKAWELPEDIRRGLMALLSGRRVVNAFGGLRAEDDDRVALCPRCGQEIGSGGFCNWERQVVNRPATEVAYEMRMGARWADFFEGPQFWTSGTEKVPADALNCAIDSS